MNIKKTLAATLLGLAGISSACGQSGDIAMPRDEQELRRVEEGLVRYSNGTNSHRWGYRNKSDAPIQSDHLIDPGFAGLVGTLFFVFYKPHRGRR
ncbi:MAG: hypothetical protein KKB21_02290 [Nanoarchaeota archaeon]|nr:hypothetical protein [Nanoarchaeota archaeon]MBU4086385.1 hypothetical protein [Nanoarchaeota archaeon]